MTPRRIALSVALLAAVALAVGLDLPSGPDARVATPTIGNPEQEPNRDRAEAFTESDDPMLVRFGRHAVAHASGDVDELAALAEGDDPAALRAARDLADLPDLDPALRLRMLERIDALRIDDPLARRERTELSVALGRAAEAAGELATAVDAFRDALPDARAVEAIARLEADPFRRANAYLQARLYRQALEALAGRIAPSIEAPAHAGLDEHEQALDAYLRWRDEVPDDRDALEGVAWSHWYLGDLAAAEAAFLRLGGSTGAYGLGLIANRRGDVDLAVRHFVSTGDARRLWLATTLLERENRWADAVEVYLELAEGTSAYADDAAWRTRVLGLRHDRPEWVAAGDALVPPDSWFALRLGAPAPGPSRDDLPELDPDAVRTARSLAEVDDLDGARLVLSFALRDAIQRDETTWEAGEREATLVALGEALAALDEYRQPQRAVAPLMEAGSTQFRTWRLAYPEAWPTLVRLEAKRAKVDPYLIWSVMRRESAFFPDAVSRSGAQGLMQVMPTTWTWLAEIQDEPPGDPFDVADNIRYGATYLGWLDDYFDGETFLMVPSYNRGQGYIRRLFDGPDVRRDEDELLRSIDALETREYLQAVSRSYRIYQRLAQIEAEGFDGTPSSGAP